MEDEGSKEQGEDETARLFITSKKAWRLSEEGMNEWEHGF